MKWSLLFHIDKAVGSNFSSPMGRGRGCCSLLKHIYAVCPELILALGRACGNRAVLTLPPMWETWSANCCGGKGRCVGCRNISVHPHSAFLVLPPAVCPVQGGRCQGSSWGRENHLSSCCSEALGQCGNTAAKQPPYKWELVAEAPMLQPFMYFMEDLLGSKEPCS